MQEVARRLLFSVRSYDFVGRYGGEEFLVVLNNCRADAVFTRAEEVRKTVCMRPIQTDAGTLGIAMSLGALLDRDWGHNCVRLAKPEELREIVPAPQPAGERFG